MFLPDHLFPRRENGLALFFQNWLVNSAYKYLHVPLGGEGGWVISDEEGYKKLAMVAGEGKNDVNNPHLFIQIMHTHGWKFNFFLNPELPKLQS